MLQNAGTVFEQVLVLFLIACIGYICGKREILTEDTANGLASICLYAVAPCLMNAVEFFAYICVCHGGHGYKHCPYRTYYP